MSAYSRHQRNLRLVHHLADHQQAVAVGRLAQHLQALFAQALEAVRRTARLERAAANHPRAGRRHHLRRALDLLAALHAARPGHHHHAAPPISTPPTFTTVPPGRKLRLASL